MVDRPAQLVEDAPLSAMRNCSLRPDVLCCLFALLAVVALGIALGWAWFGAWLILPFAGLEIALLAVALLWHARHVGDGERIWVADGRLIVQVQRAQQVQRMAFEPQRLRVVVEAGEPPQVWLSCASGRLELGRELDAPRRRELARRLAQRIAALRA